MTDDDEDDEGGHGINGVEDTLLDNHVDNDTTTEFDSSDDEAVCGHLNTGDVQGEEALLVDPHEETEDEDEEEEQEESEEEEVIQFVPDPCFVVEEILPMDDQAPWVDTHQRKVLGPSGLDWRLMNREEVIALHLDLVAREIRYGIYTYPEFLDPLPDFRNPQDLDTLDESE
jgi:hypothetical protein